MCRRDSFKERKRLGVVVPDMMSGFTLLELLIAVAVLGVLAAIVVVVLNPVELLRQSRDANRISELNAIHKGLSLFELEVRNGSLGSTSTVYISVPDPTATTTLGTSCAGIGLTTSSLPSGWSYHCAASSTFRFVDGTGWIPVNFTLIPSRAPFGKLPTDPVNTTSSGNYYTYVPGGSWELTATMEAAKNRGRGAGAKDNGVNDYVLERGSSLSLTPGSVRTRGFGNLLQNLIAYWKMEEVSGTRYDARGTNNLSSVNGVTQQTGIIGSAAQFNPSSTQYLTVPSNSNLDPGDSDFTWALWVYVDALPSETGSRMGIVRKLNGGWSAGTAYNVEMIEGNQWRFGTGNGSSFTQVATTANNTKQQWHFVLYWHDAAADTVNLQIDNGAVVTTSHSGGAATGATSVDIGLNASGATYMRGRIDEVGFWRRVLTADERTALYNNSKGLRVVP